VSVFVSDESEDQMTKPARPETDLFAEHDPADAPGPAMFFQWLRVFMVLLVPFTLGYILAMLVQPVNGFFDRREMVFSTGVNLALLLLLTASWLLHRRVTRGADPEQAERRGYNVMVFATALIVAFCLIHLHLIGSLSSLDQLLLIAVLTVVSWFFRWREVMIFFILGHAGLVAIVALESAGVLAYAPILREGPRLAEVYLTPWAITGMAGNYLLVLIILLWVTWKLRQAFALASLRKQEAIRALQSALEQVKTLRGLVPICAHCKKIRDDQGYWNEVEVYVKQHSEADFTHSLCPACAEKHWGNLLRKGKGEK